MSNENEIDQNATPAPDGTGELVAERYVGAQLKKAKEGLLRIQVVSVLFVLVIGGYVFYITNRFRTSLEPQEAATIAKGLINQKIEEQGTQLAEYVKKEVPAYISQAPDYALKQLPEYRTQLQNQLNTQIETFAKNSAESLGTHVDKFLDNNKDSVGALMKNGQDPEATSKITANLKGMFVEYLEEAPAGGESVKAKLDSALEALTKAEARMKRLATAKDLTPSEKSAKRAIAVLLKTIDDKRMESGQPAPIAAALKTP